MEDKFPDNIFLIAGLLKKNCLNELTDSEKAVLEAWMDSSEENRQFARLIDQGEMLAEDLFSLEQYDTERATNKFFKQTAGRPQEDTPRSVVVKMYQHVFFRRTAVAALFILVTGLSWLFIFRQKTASPDQALTKQAKPMVVPGGNKAILTLSDGSQVLLDSQHNGLVSTQGMAKVVKRADGELVYEKLPGGMAGQVQYNIVSTPRGGQYQVTLPDGTAVWLNSVSSVTFPTAFNEKERLVKITGEVYFDVTRKLNQSAENIPFIVEVNNTRITVLGTEFNINSYEEEGSVKTTLVSGSVRLNNGNAAVLIRPGEQAFLEAGRNNYKVINPDMEEVLAWKNGKFVFKNASAQSIMRQVSRWYDVDIKFEDDLSGISFSGGISRKDQIAKLLELLELDGRLQFDLEGGVLSVKRKKH